MSGSTSKPLTLAEELRARCDGLSHLKGRLQTACLCCPPCRAASALEAKDLALAELLLEPNQRRTRQVWDQAEAALALGQEGSVPS